MVKNPWCGRRSVLVLSHGKRRNSDLSDQRWPNEAGSEIRERIRLADAGTNGRLIRRERAVITKHIKNVFVEKELNEESSVQNIHIAFSDKPVKYYNLDVIISVGYRVRSQRGTAFRIWASQILKDYLFKGYVLNEKRLLEERQQHEELKQAVRLMGKVLENQPLDSDQATGLMKVVSDYSYALDILDKLTTRL